MGEPLAAIVVREDDERVLRQVEALERAQNLADASIGSFEHGHVLRAHARPVVVRLHVAGIAGRP